MKNTNNNPVKTVVLITSGQPSLNPRLVKEADALAAAGYNTVVIYQYWNDWATAFDKDLLASKNWKSIRVGGSPKGHKYSYWLSRLGQKINTILAQKNGFKHGIAEQAIGRCTSLLYREAIKHHADLYIAHNLAALPATAKAAKKLRVKLGFDAEDFHRNEVSDDPDNFDVRLKTYIEDIYVPQTDYLTASSGQIAARYQHYYPSKKAITVLNVFPKTAIAPQHRGADKILKLFWFSQTVGADRGIEEIVTALSLTGKNVQLHLLGNCPQAEQSALVDLAKRKGLNSDQLQFHAPVSPNKLFSFATQFDIGIASETGTPLNRDICLTNKIFTYIQCGLGVIATNTTAQQELLYNYPSVGNVYKRGDHNALAAIIKTYCDDPALLVKTRQAAYNLGQTNLNWELESRKFLDVVKSVLNN